MNTTTTKKTPPSDYFAEVLSRLTPAAARCDVALHVRTAAGAMVNNFREGRDASLKERIAYLNRKMTERRVGRWQSVTLASLFPADAKMIAALKL